MLALERENTWDTSSFLPVAVAVVFPEQCSSRTVPRGLQRLFSQGLTVLDRVATMRVHQGAKFSIFAFVISCCLACKVLHQRITSVPSKVSQTQFFLMPPSCQWIIEFSPISWSHRGYKDSPSPFYVFYHCFYRDTAGALVRAVTCYTRRHHKPSSADSVNSELLGDATSVPSHRNAVQRNSLNLQFAAFFTLAFCTRCTNITL